MTTAVTKTIMRAAITNTDPTRPMSKESPYDGVTRRFAGNDRVAWPNARVGVDHNALAVEPGPGDVAVQVHAGAGARVDEGLPVERGVVAGDREAIAVGSGCLVAETVREGIDAGVLDGTGDDAGVRVCKSPDPDVAVGEGCPDWVGVGVGDG